MRKEEMGKDEGEENQGDRMFIQRDVYTKYFRYTAKMEVYTNFVYTSKLE